MWQEDLTAQVADVLQRPEVVLTTTPAHISGDWATVILPPVAPEQILTRVHQVPGVQHAQWQGGRVVLTLTPAARGQVVSDLLLGRPPRHQQHPGHHRAGATGHQMLARAAPGTTVPHLYPVRLAHARTAMLLRQGRDHQVLAGRSPEQADLARLWGELAPTCIEPAAVRDLLLALGTSHLALVRAGAQGRPAPVVSNLRRVAEAFTDWFTRTRYTPRGSLPARDAPIMDTYRLHLALAAATGLALRAGLTRIGLTAPEHL